MPHIWRALYRYIILSRQPLRLQKRDQPRLYVRDVRSGVLLPSALAVSIHEISQARYPLRYLARVKIRQKPASSCGVRGWANSCSAALCHQRALATATGPSYDHAFESGFFQLSYFWSKSGIPTGGLSPHERWQ